MGLFSQQKPERFVLIFNVGSGQVRAAVARFEHGTVPVVMYSTASYIPFFDLDDKERYERAMLATLLDVAMRVSTNYLATLTRGIKKRMEFVCVLSSPWFVEATRSVTFKKKSPFTITRELIENLQKKEREGFEESLKTGRGRHASTIQVENVLVASQLNGYATASIYDRATQELRCTFHISETTETLRKHISETLSQIAGHDQIQFATSTFVSRQALRKVFPEENNFLQVVVSGECTDISIVEQGVLMTTRTFPHGTRSIARDMAQKHNMNFEEAISRVRLYISDKQALRNDAAYASFQKGFDAWLAFFTKAADVVWMGTPLPGKAVVIAEDPWQEVYAAKLKTIALSQRTMRDESLEVIAFNQAACDERACIKRASDVPFNTHIVTDVLGLS